MAEPAIVCGVDGDGTACVRLNRPEVHNAFDAPMIAALAAAFSRLAADAAVRTVVITAAGASFCAGGDLAWMRESAGFGFGDNVRDAEGLAAMLHALASLPKPTIAQVHGSAYGGGVGLIAAADIAFASEAAMFALTEVRLGLIPAVIAPYVLAAIGARAARRYMLTAERFGALEAHRLGLIHQVVPAAALEGEVRRLVGTLAGNGTHALAEAKRLIADVAGRPIDADLRRETAERIARIRAGDEARERIAAFLGRRSR